MAKTLKTVEPVPEENTDLSFSDPLLKEQQAQIAQMRSTYVSFNKGDPNSAQRAIQNITVLRVYHQISRIIKFTEVMDALEDKLYDSIISNIGEMDSFDPATMLTLLKVQQQLQETMIQSQQLIKPYMDMDVLALAPQPEMEDTPFGVSIISQESRNNIRTGAQALLTELRKANPDLPQGDNETEEVSEETPKKRGRKPKSAKVIEDTDVRSISAE